MTASKVNVFRFYNEWKGHTIEDLSSLLSLIRPVRPEKPVIYLAGDSSLDNKYWVPSSGNGGEPLSVPVPSIYNTFLDRPQPKPDVAFWLNHLLQDRATAVNCAIEESMLRERDEKLLSHDEFIRDNIREKDILVVSVGANDIAYKPSLPTILHMVRLAWLTRRNSIESGSASSLKYFKHMFGDKVQEYIKKVTEKTKPQAVIVCMIYFPLEGKSGQKSWADLQLKALGYEWWPGQLQVAIRQMYEIATKNIEVDGTKIIPCPLFEVMNGQEKEDYTERVEPSVQGGKKMATKFAELLENML